MKIGKLVFLFLSLNVYLIFSDEMNKEKLLSTKIKKRIISSLNYQIYTPNLMFI